MRIGGFNPSFIYFLRKCCHFPNVNWNTKKLNNAPLTHNRINLVRISSKCTSSYCEVQEPSTNKTNFILMQLHTLVAYDFMYWWEIALYIMCFTNGIVAQISIQLPNLAQYNAIIISFHCFYLKEALEKVILTDYSSSSRRNICNEDVFRLYHFRKPNNDMMRLMQFKSATFQLIEIAFELLEYASLLIFKRHTYILQCQLHDKLSIIQH